MSEFTILFHCLSTYHPSLRQWNRIVNSDIQLSFYIRFLQIWHQLCPETLVPSSPTTKNHFKYALPIPPPSPIIWPISNSEVVWLQQQSNWTSWNMCGCICKIHILPILVTPWQSRMIWWPRIGALPLPNITSKQNNTRTNYWNILLTAKLHNTIYANYRKKHLCKTICISIVTTQNLTSP